MKTEEKVDKIKLGAMTFEKAYEHNPIMINTGYYVKFLSRSKTEELIQLFTEALLINKD